MKTRALIAAIIILLPSFALACGGPMEGEIPSPSTYGKRSWGPEQLTGAPDTLQSGDIGTAWASLSTDDRDEWLLLTYRGAMHASQIHVYETYNPGALSRVTVFDGNREVEVWKGKDPVKVDAETGVGIAVIPVDVPFAFRRVKLYIDSKAVLGWNEIDAVGVKDTVGTVHWVARARASTTYAVQPMIIR